MGLFYSALLVIFWFLIWDLSISPAISLSQNYDLLKDNIQDFKLQKNLDSSHPSLCTYAMKIQNTIRSMEEADIKQVNPLLKDTDRIKSIKLETDNLASRYCNDQN